MVVLSADLAVPLTILWVVAVANAVNLVDGLDGLAAGMIAIAAATFFVYMTRTPSTFGDASAAALLSAITVGVCLGVLALELLPGEDLHGGLRIVAARHAPVDRDDRGVGRNPFPRAAATSRRSPAC